MSDAPPAPEPSEAALALLEQAAQVEAPELYADAEGLDAALSRLQDGRPLAIDSEGDGMFRYRGRLCVLQMATSNGAMFLDCLAVDATDGLRKLLGPEGPEKLIHDASFDARMLWSASVALGNVFDTAVAARMLGIKATGLASLLAARFGIQLDKSHQQTDWGERPLPSDTFPYLLDDVRYLRPLALELRREVQQAGIVEEVAVETQYLLDQACLPTAEAVSPWTRLKGARTLLPIQQSVLRELAELRETLARERDVPPGRLIANAVLLKLAERRPKDAPALQKAVRLRADLRALVPELLEAVAHGVERGAPPRGELRENKLPPSVTAERKRRRQLLTQLRAEAARERGVDLQVVLPGHCVNDLCALEALDMDGLRSVSGLGECRLDRYGEALLQALRPPA